jgi:pyrimidine operon attenuation protein / uracil phosphoribosyltransferase
MSSVKTLVLNSKQIEQKINRIAYEVYENNYTEKEVIIAGISDGGFQLAQRISKTLEAIAPIKTKLIELHINKDNPLEEDPTHAIPASQIKNKVVILVDDVLNSGKTLMYGAKSFLNVPLKKLSTAVLVDRNHTRFPIKADFVGISLSTTLKEHVTVELGSKGKEGVYLL